MLNPDKLSDVADDAKETRDGSLSDDEEDDDDETVEVKMTVDELVSGSLESSFWAMDRLILKDKENYKVYFHFDCRSRISSDITFLERIMLPRQQIREI